MVKVSSEGLPSLVSSMLAYARGRVYIASYLFPTGSVYEALLAHTRRQEVDLRVIVNYETVNQLRYQKHVDDFDEVLRFYQGVGSMHMKLLLIDDRVLVGSYNFQDPSTSRDVVMVTDDPEAVQTSLTTFTALWDECKSHTSSNHHRLSRTEYDAMIDAVVNYQGGWNDFTKGIYTFLQSRGFLTRSQEAALKLALNPEQASSSSNEEHRDLIRRVVAENGESSFTRGMTSYLNRNGALTPKQVQALLKAIAAVRRSVK